MLNRAVIAAPFGFIAIQGDEQALTGIDLMLETDSLIEPESAVLKRAARQFEAYFHDSRWTFDLPLVLHGSPLRLHIWDAIRGIASGSVRSYGTLARELRTGARVVAGACRANSFPIVIPCHRVVATHGLGGYCGQLGGPLLDIKRWLLRHEGYAHT